MPSDSNGQYSLVSSYFVQTGDTVLPVQHNPVFEDVAQALTNRVMKDGRTVWTGDMKAGGFRITGMGPGQADDDAATVGQIGTKASFKTVPELLADTDMSYSTGPVRVSEGDRVEADDFPYEVLGSDADTSLQTAGGVKLKLVAHVWRPAAYGIASSAEDQKSILQEFVNDAAESGAPIEWGAIDVSINPTDSGLTPGQRGLMVPSNSLWYMHPETRIRALPTDSANYAILGIRNASDIQIYGNGARLIGERYAHTGVSGEFGMGVEMRGASDVLIADLGADECWGDGYYIGVSPEQNFCENVTLIRPSGRDNRRQGLSLISAKHFHCEDDVWENTNGVAPQAGVDIEPNDPSEFLEDIVFVRTRTAGNTGPGFYIFLTSMSGTANPVSITVDGLHDVGSDNGLALTCRGTVPGVVRINSPLLEKSDLAGILAREWHQTGPKLILNRPIVRGCNQNNSALAGFASGVSILATSGVPAGVLGNIEIIEPTVEGGNPVHGISMIDERSPRDGTSGVRVIDPIRLDSSLSKFRGTADDTGFIFTDRRKILRSAISDASQSLSTTAFYTEVSNANFTAERTLTLATNFPVGTVIRFTVDVGQYMRIVPTGSTIRPMSNLSGGWVRSNEVGAVLEIEKVTSAYWRVLKRSGAWEVQT